MKKIFTFMSVIEVICGIVFLLSSASDIQIGFGLLMFVDGVRALASSALVRVK